MKILIFLTVLILNQQQIVAWIGLLGYNPQELKQYGNENSHCFTSAHNLGAFKNGEVKRIKDQCAIAECLENRSIKLTGCAPVGVEPPCYIGPGNLSKPFAECCFELICPPEEQEVKNEID